MDERTKTLVGLGASVAVNCRPCLEHHLAQAREVGLIQDEIRDAVAVGQKVARGAAGKMREFAAKALEDPVGSEEGCCSSAGRGCG